MTNILFVHGGGDEAYDYDKRIVDKLQKSLGAEKPIAFPHVGGLEVIDWAIVKADLGKLLGDLEPRSIVVAHSIGAAAVVKLLAEGVDPKLAHLFLLAPPYNGTDGDWGDSDFAFAADFARHLPKGLPITLWHSEDDEVIDVENARHYARKLAHAKVVIVHDYGHQFTGKLDFLASAIRGVAP